MRWVESSKTSPYILSEAVNDIEDLCDLLLQRAIHVSYSKSMIEDVRLSAYPSSYDARLSCSDARNGSKGKYFRGNESANDAVANYITLLLFISRVIILLDCFIDVISTKLCLLAMCRHHHALVQHLLTYILAVFFGRDDS